MYRLTPAAPFSCPQGADTANRFFLDPNFDFQKEGAAYQKHGAQTESMFGGLAATNLPPAADTAAPSAATEEATDEAPLIDATAPVTKVAAEPTAVSQPVAAEPEIDAQSAPISAALAEALAAAPALIGDKLSQFSATTGTFALSLYLCVCMRARARVCACVF